MANSIEMAKKYLPVVDGVFQKTLRSGILDTPAIFTGVGVDQAQVLKVAAPKLVNYADGYGRGDITSSYETITLPFKRSRQLTIEATDEDENFNRLLGATLAEFIKTSVAPELDAIRFASFASKAGIGSVEETITSSNAYTSLFGALGAIENAEADLTNSVLFVSSGIFAGVNKETTAGTIMTISQLKEKFGLIDIRYVPQARFNTTITLTPTGSGGYTLTGQDINYMVVDKSAVIQVVKKEQSKLFTPEENQNADGYIFDFLIYHTAYALDNKAAGIYLSKKPAV